MEPHWNKTRLYQAASRGIRRGDNPSKNIRIKTYLSTIPEKKPLLGDKLQKRKHITSSDEYLLGMSKRKQKENDRFLNALEPK